MANRIVGAKPERNGSRSVIGWECVADGVVIICERDHAEHFKAAVVAQDADITAIQNLSTGGAGTNGERIHADE